MSNATDTMTVVEAREVLQAVYDLSDNNHGSDLLNIIGAQVANALLEIQSVERELRTQLAQVRRDVERTEEYLLEGYGLNPRGEFQSSARDFDATCARRQDVWALFRKMTMVAREAGMDVDVDSVARAVVVLANQ